MVLPREDRDQLRAEVRDEVLAAVTGDLAEARARADTLEAELRSQRDQRVAERRALRRGQLLGEPVDVADVLAAALGLSAAELRSALHWVVAQRRGVQQPTRR